MTSVQIIEDLRLHWNQLSDPEKADRLLQIPAGEISGRKLASLLGRSEALLRHIKKATLATAADRELMRQGKLSTRAVVARTATRARPIPSSAEPRKILEWCRSQTLLECDILQVIREARRILLQCIEAGTIPKYVAREGITLDDIIARTKPLPSEDCLFTAYYAIWLARWTCFAYPDLAARDAALQQASACVLWKLGRKIQDLTI